MKTLTLILVLLTACAGSPEPTPTERAQKAYDAELQACRDGQGNVAKAQAQCAILHEAKNGKSATPALLAATCPGIEACQR